MRSRGCSGWASWALTKPSSKRQRWSVDRRSRWACSGIHSLGVGGIKDEGCWTFHLPLRLSTFRSFIKAELLLFAVPDTGGASGKEPTCQCRRYKKSRFDPWVRKIPLEEAMANHSSILAWRIPWTEEPGGLQSIESQRVRHDWNDHTGKYVPGKMLKLTDLSSV